MSYYAHTRPLGETGIEPFTFAGFSWPQYVADMREGSLRARLNEYKSTKHMVPCVGPYYHAPRPEQAGKGRGFYLDEEGRGIGRWWRWADDVCNYIRHTGWYTDDYCDGKIRGIVIALPHGRFMAGWSMGEGMASSVAGDLYDDEEEAARAADEEARMAAERQREYEEEEAARAAAESRETEMHEED